MNVSDKETLRLSIEQLDASGQRMSLTTVEWPNMPNALANTCNLSLTEAILAEVAKWNAAKNPG